MVQWDGSTESHRKTRVYGERIDELLEYTDISADPDEVYYAHTDLLGSVQVMVDDTGAIAESYRYTDWGQTTVVDSSFAKLGSLGSNIGNFIRYTGRERAIMATVGDDWYFYRARMYRPDAGRFGQRDPLRYVDGASMYTYVRHAPLTLTDATGRNTPQAGGPVHAGPPAASPGGNHIAPLDEQSGWEHRPLYYKKWYSGCTQEEKDGIEDALGMLPYAYKGCTQFNIKCVDKGSTDVKCSHVDVETSGMDSCTLTIERGQFNFTNPLADGSSECCYSSLTQAIAHEEGHVIDAFAGTGPGMASSCCPSTGAGETDFCEWKANNYANSVQAFSNHQSTCLQLHGLYNPAYTTMPGDCNPWNPTPY